MCIYLYIIFRHIYIYTQIHRYIDTYIHMHIYTCLRKDIYVYTYDIFSYTRTYICTHTHVYIRISYVTLWMHARVHLCVHVCMSPSLSRESPTALSVWLSVCVCAFLRMPFFACTVECQCVCRTVYAMHIPKP